MMKRIKERKLEAKKLVQYANPKSRSKINEAELMEILKKHIPYKFSEGKPEIKNVAIEKFNRNSIIKSAYFIIELSNGAKWKISAYDNLKGRSEEVKERDKNATFPSGLFRIFHDEIN